MILESFLLEVSGQDQYFAKKKRKMFEQSEKILNNG